MRTHYITLSLLMTMWEKNNNIMSYANSEGPDK